MTNIAPPNRPHTARIALIFDDGYQSNVNVAAPLLARHGYSATMAIEIPRMGTLYTASNLPVLGATDARTLVTDYGWELAAHPFLNLVGSEAEMVADVGAEVALLRDILTGAKLPTGTFNMFDTGPVTHPEFADYPVDFAVYQGGARNETSDRAYRYVFDHGIRSIPGSLEQSGDVLLATDELGEQPMNVCAFPWDTTSVSLDDIKGWISGIANTGGMGIAYAHHTPEDGAGTASTPAIYASELAAVLNHCAELGIAVVPFSRLFRGNCVADPRFEASSGSLHAAPEDDAIFTESMTLNGAARAVRLTATEYRGNQGVSYSPATFAVQPFCRYRLRLRYRIATDLVLNGGLANRNHGLACSLTTTQGNAQATFAGVCDDYDLNSVGNDDFRRPYEQTDGYDEHAIMLTTGNGCLATLNIGLFQCVGTVEIGHIVIEKLTSLLRAPLTYSRNFAGASTVSIPLPTVGASGARGWTWACQLLAAPRYFGSDEADELVDTAEMDSADVIGATAGDRVYVLGTGIGDFAGQGGLIATSTGGGWTFAAPAIGGLIRSEGMSQGLAAGRTWLQRGRSTLAGAQHIELFGDDFVDATVQSSATAARVSSVAGVRTDPFVLIARPTPVIVPA